MNPHLSSALSHNLLLFAHNKVSGSDFKDIIHLHDGIELHYIDQGSGQVVVGKKTIKITDGILLFFQPFQLHKLAVQATDQRPFIRSYLLYDPVLIHHCLRAFPRLMEFHELIWKRSLESQAITGLHSGHPIVEQFQRLSHLLTQDLSIDQMREQQVLHIVGFLGLLQQYWSHDNQDGLTVHRRPLGHAEQAMEWIDQNFMKPFQLQDLADHLHLSAPYLSSLFRRELGENLTDYLTARRIKEASRLLESSSLPLDQIAYQIGIHNVSYFCQLFKKKTGETPHNFRMKVK